MRFKEWKLQQKQYCARFAFGKPLLIRDRGVEGRQEIVEFIEGKIREWEREP